jgi:hypothetical protein
MKIYGGVELHSPPRRQMEVSSQPHATAAFLPGKEPPRYALDRMLSVRKTVLEAIYVAVQGIEPLTVQPVAVLFELSRLRI